MSGALPCVHLAIYHWPTGGSNGRFRAFWKFQLSGSSSFNTQIVRSLCIRRSLFRCIARTVAVCVCLPMYWNSLSPPLFPTHWRMAFVLVRMFRCYIVGCFIVARSIVSYSIVASSASVYRNRSIVAARIVVCGWCADLVVALPARSVRLHSNCSLNLHTNLAICRMQLSAWQLRTVRERPVQC